MQTGKDPAIYRIRVGDWRIDRSVSLKGIRLAGDLAGIAYTLDPDDALSSFAMLCTRLEDLRSIGRNGSCSNFNRGGGC